MAHCWGANKGLLVDSPRRYLGTTRPKASRYFETARNSGRPWCASTALRGYRSSWLCVAPKFPDASQEQSRQYCDARRWALIWFVSTTNSSDAISSKAHSTGVAEQKAPEVASTKRAKRAATAQVHDTSGCALRTAIDLPELLIFNSILVVPACSAHVFAHQLVETLW